MTAEQIANLLMLNRRGATLKRIEKAKGLAQRYSIDWAAVQALLPATEPESTKESS